MNTSAALSPPRPNPGEGYSPRMIKTVNRRNIVMPTSTPFTFEIQMFRSLRALNETTGLAARGSHHKKKANEISARTKNWTTPHGRLPKCTAFVEVQPQYAPSVM